MCTTTTWQHRWSNWACGGLAVMVGLCVRGALLGLYRGVAAASPLHLAFGPAAVIGAFVALDLLAYWQHRLEHAVPLLWAVHEVHHQSALCDASVSLRTSALAPVTTLTPHLALALCGVDVRAYLLASAVHVGLMFLLHARTPRWLDRAGLVFNSPFLHRGHHATHPRLRGRNFGGVFILWDRLFGTFEARCEVAQAFGVPGRPTPLSPLEANLAPWRRLLRRGAAPTAGGARG